MSLESQRNWEKKEQHQEVLTWDAQRGFGNGETFEGFRLRRDVMLYLSNQALVQRVNCRRRA